MSDATGVAEAMLGLRGFRCLGLMNARRGRDSDRDDRLPGGLPGCGVVARAHDRMVVEYRDLAAFGRPARLVWIKRRWRCEEPGCATRSWTESSPCFSSRCLLTRRAAAECCRQVGRNARPVTQMASELGVCWDTVMDAIREHGEPLVDDPVRVGVVAQLGVDETSWLAANKDHATLYPTGLVDLRRRVVIDVIPGNSAKDLGPGLIASPLGGSRRSVSWRPIWPSPAGKDSPAASITQVRVADPFHVVRLANRCLDQVRRRVQNQTLGHRGRKRDPLYRIRKLMLTGAERLEAPGLDRMLLGIRAGDPDDEVLGAWLAKESVRDIYLTDHRPDDAGLLLDKAIEGCAMDPVDEIRSLGRTLARWQAEILAHHTTGASNGPTEGLNLLIKKVNAPATAYAHSPTTGSESCSTQAASTGPPSDPGTTDPNPLAPLKPEGPLWSAVGKYR